MSLTNAPAFFDAVRAGILGPSLHPDEVSGCNAILKACEGWPLPWTAYALATAYHETAHTMQPIKEYGGPTYFRRMYGVDGDRRTLALKHGHTCAGDGETYFGRGYVQLTWKCNYARAEKECGHPLVARPDLALREDVAAQVMRRGMEEGWFTGKRLADYLTPKCSDYTGARRIINGTDKAALIKGYAMQFQSALQAGGWR